MIEKFDDENKTKLSNEYISIIEVGGAYAHKFYNFLEFIDTYCLVITDIDFIDRNENNKKCFYEEDKELHSSNHAIKNWFKDSEEPGYIEIDDSLKIGVKENKKLMITFQLKDVDLESPSNKLIFDTANNHNTKKLDFAIEYGIENNQWNIPDYIIKGLEWLSEGGD